VVQAVQLEDLPGLLREVEGFRGGELHLGGQFVAADAGLQPVVARAGGGVLAVELPEQVEAGGVAGPRREPGPLVGEQVGDRGLGPGVDDRPLVLGGEEGAVPVLGPVGRQPAVVRQDDERRQVIADVAQAVADLTLKYLSC